jgi:hypothetical protein
MMKRINKLSQIIIIGLAVIAWSFIALEFVVESCWVIILSSLCGYLILIGFTLKKEWIKIICFNLAAILFALMLLEGYLWYKNYLKLVLTDKLTKKTLLYDEYDHELGYRPKRNFSSYQEKKIGDKLLYKSLISFKNHLRYTPNNNPKSDSSMLFFGCSFMLGQGLSDNQTLPFYLNSRIKSQVFNYGNHGYGPHQMLKQIETRLENDIKNIKGKKNALYSFIPHHISRATGKSKWDIFGPKYELINNKLVNTGPFNSNEKTFLNYLLFKVYKSYLYIKFINGKKATYNDLLTTIAILKKSKFLLQKRKIDLRILIWDDPNSISGIFHNTQDYQNFINELVKANFTLYFVSNAIPDYQINHEKYVILNDGHPNSVANETIAKYLYLQLLKK